MFDHKGRGREFYRGYQLINCSDPTLLVDRNYLFIGWTQSKTNLKLLKIIEIKVGIWLTIDFIDLLTIYIGSILTRTARCIRSRWPIMSRVHRHSFLCVFLFHLYLIVLKGRGVQSSGRD